MQKFIKKNWPKFLGATALVVVAVLVYSYTQKNSPTELPIAKNPQEAMIESKGLAEFSPENNTVDTVSSQDKKLVEEMLPIFKLMGDGRDARKNNEAALALSKIVEKYPEYSDAYFLRATNSILADDKNYPQILSDIDSAVKFHSSDRYKSSYDSTATMYGLRAKVDMLSGDFLQAMNDMAIAVKIDPHTNDWLKSGGVKPEDTSDPTALSKADFDLLVQKYPDDYRGYMFRGLFYNFFTSFNKAYCSSAIDDLQHALSINPSSAITYYFLGKGQSCDLLSTVAKASDSYRAQVNDKALQYFVKATELDPKFTDAYTQAAEAFFELKRYSEAIPYYDKVIELDPGNAGAYNDRGLAQSNLGNYYAAIDDFGKAIENKTGRNLVSSYQNRADAYVKTNNYDSAIEDYSKAIGLTFSQQMISMSVSQIRSIYPEFNGILDQDLLEGFRRKYFANISSADFSSQYQQNNKPFEDFILAGLYASRGDAYLGVGNFRKAANEYARALHDDSTYVLDRWKVISKTPGTEYSVDTQTLDFGQGNIVSLWVKVLDTKTQNYSQQNYQIDCVGRKIKSASVTNYDSVGNAVYTGPAQDWQSIVPESIGEVLYNAMCK